MFDRWATVNSRLHVTADRVAVTSAGVTGRPCLSTRDSLGNPRNETPQVNVTEVKRLVITSWVAVFKPDLLPVLTADVYTKLETNVSLKLAIYWHNDYI